MGFVCNIVSDSALIDFANHLDTLSARLCGHKITVLIHMLWLLHFAAALKESKSLLTMVPCHAVPDPAHCKLCCLVSGHNWLLLLELLQISVRMSE